MYVYTKKYIRFSLWREPQPTQKLRKYNIIVSSFSTSCLAPVAAVSSKHLKVQLGVISLLASQSRKILIFTKSHFMGVNIKKFRAHRELKTRKGKKNNLPPSVVHAKIIKMPSFRHFGSQNIKFESWHSIERGTERYLYCWEIKKYSESAIYISICKQATLVAEPTLTY